MLKRLILNQDHPVMLKRLILNQDHPDDDIE